MTEIVQFIKAQLDLDEAGALDAAAFYDNDPEDVTWRVDEGANENGFKRAWLVPHLGVINDLASAHHMVRHSPARVLAEVAAKRVILAEHKHVPATEPSSDDFGCQICAYDRGDCVLYGWGWCNTVRLLAAPYAGQPGFKPEWRLS